MGKTIMGGVVLATAIVTVSALAQIPPSPTSTVRKVLATAVLTSVTNTPLYFKAQSIALMPGEKIRLSGANSVLYQRSGSAAAAGVGETKALTAGDGLLIATGTRIELTGTGATPAALLVFSLAPASDLDGATVSGTEAVRELYRTSAPIPDLKSGAYDLNLTQVTFPAGMPSNAPHHRSGAALYYVISGTGANTIDGKTEARGPGSFVYEPFGLVHQWANPGNEPLTFVTFNINPQGVAAVLPGSPARAP